MSAGELRKKLIDVVQKLEQESEDMLKQFKEDTGTIGTDRFLKEFKGLRKSLHLNQARLERLNQRE